MYSVNITVCLLVNEFKREKQLTDICQRGHWEIELLI